MLIFVVFGSMAIKLVSLQLVFSLESVIASEVLLPFEAVFDLAPFGGGNVSEAFEDVDESLSRTSFEELDPSD